ncbi:unnamed protein product [Caenorhabditis bovis]|uniref:Histone deacetylase domain-containing protein n=1 Tax=Caenorhabditis bovis TaxID=2654633 RepID=A0A8S1ETG6_9PELO|nr:unnamed protein product [Caenorhabditis bovis]
MPQFGYVYDERMMKHDCAYDETMAECPERMKLIFERLKHDGLLDNAVQVKAREATDAELLLNHPIELINEIKSLETTEKCEDYCRDKEILWTCAETDEAARVAVGGAIELVKQAVDGRIQNGFAIIRPPGHHSFGKTPQGYCIFNNVAIAAKYALDVLKLKKVAIVDFDYHPANGTYMSVKDDDRIHLTSIHAYHYGAFWPFSTTYDYDTNNKNHLFVPLNGTMNTEGDYVSIFHHVLIPMLKTFQPELILISAGFDSGYFDVMMEFGQGVKAHGYGHMARLLNEICPGKTLAVLEGGYFAPNYTESAAMMVRGLMGLSLPIIALPERISGSLVETLWNIINHHAVNYPILRENLNNLKRQQCKLGLAPFAFNQKVFMGEKLRKIYDEVKRMKIVRTRQWFPQLSDELVELCTNKIEAYKKEYVYSKDHKNPSFDFLLEQCIWDDWARSEAFLQAAPFTAHLIKEFNDFVEGKIQNMMICDQVLYREAVKTGKIDKFEPITKFSPRKSEISISGVNRDIMPGMPKNAKTVEEIENELVFSAIPDSGSEDGSHDVFDDEFDAQNAETFGAELDDITDAELESYAAQTARLRLDDPVWENPSSSSVTAAPDASQIPIPSFFGSSLAFDYQQIAENSMIDKNIWDKSEISLSPISGHTYSLWGVETIAGIQPSLPKKELELGDLSDLLGEGNTVYRSDEREISNTAPKKLNAIPQTALTLEEIERLHIEDKQFDNMNLKPDISKVLSESGTDPLNVSMVPPGLPLSQGVPVAPRVPVAQCSSVSQNVPVQQNIAPSFKGSAMPPGALSVEDLEKEMLQKTKNLSLNERPPQQMVPVEIQPQMPDFSVQPPQYPVMMPSPVPMPIPVPVPVPPAFYPPFPPQMAMPLPVNLPKLPPLHPQYLPCIPVWISHIINRCPLPANYPPAPTILHQLLCTYKNPTLVHHMIIQSSIPPQHTSIPPHMMQRQAFSPTPSMTKRKPAGMPSFRTIEDLAFDSFAGYMSWKEREWLVRIQLEQCKGSGDPQTEDYYYLTWRKNKIANGWKPKPKAIEASAPANETSQDYEERIRRMNYREMQKERAKEREQARKRERAEREKERANRENEERKPRFAKFASSLGLPSKSTTANPRHLIDMTKAAEDVAKNVDEERKVAVAKKLRTMLLRLEGAINLLIDVNELRKKDLPEKSKFKGMTNEEKEAEIEKRTNAIIEELMGDDLHKLLQMSKGRQAKIIIALMSAGALVNKKMYGEIVTDLLPTIFSCLSQLHKEQFAVLVEALNVDILKRQLLDNNSFIRDVMLTIFYVSIMNNQPLLDWAKHTKFPSLVLTANNSLMNWRRAMSTISDSDIRWFADRISDSGIRGADELAKLIEEAV